MSRKTGTRRRRRQGDQVAVQAVRGGRRARSGERQGLDAPLGQARLDRCRRRASASSGVMAGSGSKKAVWSSVPSVRTVRITRVGASVGGSRAGRGRRRPGAAPRSGAPTAPPRNVDGPDVGPAEARQGAGDVVPLAADHLAHGRPADRVAGRQGGTVSVLSRQGFSVTQRIMTGAVARGDRGPVGRIVPARRDRDVIRCRAARRRRSARSSGRSSAGAASNRRPGRRG